METDSDLTPSSGTPASSIINLFFNEINKQDVGGLLQVQNSLYVAFISIKKKMFIEIFYLDSNN
jgi:hypothetical protein